MSALYEFSLQEDHHHQKLLDDAQLSIQRALDIKGMQDKKRQEEQDKKEQLLLKSQMRNAEKAYQSEQRALKLNAIKEKRNKPEAVSLVKNEHEKHSHRVGSPCHPSRETLEFVYRKNCIKNDDNL